MDLAFIEQEREEPNITELTPIQEFYKDAHILITGGTGFLGKLLIEKLLRSCNELSKIYLIVRSKKGKDMPIRLKEIFQDVLFDRLKRQYPNFEQKIRGIAGDCTLPNLGLTSEDRKLLQDNVNIIFHVAATVRFDEKLKTAMVTNVQATKDMLQLAREVQYLKSFMYVSTAYSNCVEKVIEEKIYKPAASCESLLTFASFPEWILEPITTAVLDKYPNTYVFSKQVAEGLIDEYGKGLPIGILRPSIVVSTYQEPISGWIDSANGPTGVIAGFCIGLIRALHADSTAPANIVPGDMVINSLIAACWEVGVAFQEKSHSEMKIYNYESNTNNPVTWGLMEKKLDEALVEYPTVKLVWHPFRIRCKRFYHMRLVTFLLHTIPAYLADAFLMCTGKERTVVKMYTKIQNVIEKIGYFSTKNFLFMSENIGRMLDKMSPRDRDIFFCDISAISWDDFFITFVKGIRVYLFQDPLDTLKEGLAKARRLYWSHQILKAVLITPLLSLLWNLLKCIF